MVSIWFATIHLFMLIRSQYPFPLNIPSISTCSFCKFNWPTLSHYGYSFVIDSEEHSELVTFSAITINYDSYNSSHSSCDIGSGFIEAYNYQISIYYRPSSASSWTSKGTKSGSISREQTNSNIVSLQDLTPSIPLISGVWYIGLRLSWNRLSQQCDC